jgi:hypothetical protein
MLGDLRFFNQTKKLEKVECRTQQIGGVCIIFGCFACGTLTCWFDTKERYWILECREGLQVQN